MSDVPALEKGLSRQCGRKGTPQNVFLEHAGHPVADQQGRKVQTRKRGCYGEGNIGLSLGPLVTWSEWARTEVADGIPN